MLFRTHILFWTLSFFVGLAFDVSADETTAERRYSIPGHGTLSLIINEAWKEEFNQPPNDLPPTIKYWSDSFQILVTVLWSPKQDKNFNKLKSIKQSLEPIAQNLLPTAEETDIDFKNLFGMSSMGTYFSLTDKSPKKGGYKYVTAGAVGTGDLLLSFTILTNEKNSKEEKVALEMLRNAKQERGSSKDEIVETYHVGILNFNLFAVLAYAAGMPLEVIKDTPSEYEIILINDVHIIAKEMENGIEVRLKADDIGKGKMLLNTLMTKGEEMEASHPTLHLRGKVYEEKKTVLNKMLADLKAKDVIRNNKGME